MVARGTLTQTSALQEACFSDGLLAVPDVSATTLRYACASPFLLAPVSITPLLPLAALRLLRDYTTSYSIRSRL